VENFVFPVPVNRLHGYKVIATDSFDPFSVLFVDSESSGISFRYIPITVFPMGRNAAWSNILDIHPDRIYAHLPTSFALTEWSIRASLWPNRAPSLFLIIVMTYDLT